MEIWKAVIDFEGQYEISTLGRLKSLKRKAKTHNNGFLNIEERILKFNVDSRGYCMGHLCRNSKIKNIRIHQLVAKAFIENPF